MLVLLRTQQQEIEMLRLELTQQRNTTDTVNALQSHILNLESALSTRLVGALSEHSVTECILCMHIMQLICALVIVF